MPSQSAFDEMIKHSYSSLLLGFAKCNHTDPVVIHHRWESQYGQLGSLLVYIYACLDAAVDPHATQHI